jgi:ABC-type transport system involved in multi-copper enzyme maturation permease subunit
VNAALIARNTFREAMRDRIVSGVVIGGLLVLLGTQLVAPLALGEGLRLTVDLGLSAISLLGLLVILLVGSSLVGKEIERRTIFNLLSRPIARPAYLVGKWAGLAAALWATTVALGLGLVALVALRGAGRYAGALCESLLLAGLELSVITAIAVLFSALSTPALSALYTLGAFVVGQWSEDLRGLAMKLAPAPRLIVEAFSHVVPNLSLFNMRSLAAAGEITTPLHLGIAAAYATCYVACALALASAALESRDFK